jgi:hypothetical protein
MRCAQTRGAIGHVEEELVRVKVTVSLPEPVNEAAAPRALAQLVIEGNSAYFSVSDLNDEHGIGPNVSFESE